MTDTSTIAAPPPPSSSLDARLVRAYLAGDRSALGGIYDRYAAGLYDTAAAMLSDRHEAADVVQDVFLLACEKLAQLRDPDRLKPWLYSIARHEIYRRTKRRSRHVLKTFDPEDGPEMVAPADPMGAGAQLEYTELAELVRASASGLDERDQLVLELSVRQGLQGTDLAAALGVTPEQSYTLVHRMRERVEKSLGALVVARAGRKDCAALADVLKGWDGTFSVLIRKRVARHVESCDTCDRTRRKVAPLALFSAAPAMALPVALRERVLHNAGGEGSPPQRAYRWDEDGGFPKLGSSVRRLVAFLLGGAAVLVLGVLGGRALASRNDDVRVSAGPTPTTLSAATPASASPATAAATASTATPADAAAPNTVESTAAPITLVPAVASTAASTAPPTVAPVPTTAVTPIPVPTDPPPTSPPRTSPPRTAPPRTSPPRTSPPRTNPPTKPPTPGKLTLSQGSVDFGADGSSSTIKAVNSGGTPIDIGVDGGSDVFSVGLGAVRLDPGQSVAFRVRFARKGAAEGDYSAEYLITGPNPQRLQLSARVEHDPSVRVSADPASQNDCQGVAFVSVVASISDESPPLKVTGTVLRIGVRVANFSLSDKGDWYGRASIKPAEPGDYVVRVTATDSRGNRASDTTGFSIYACKP